MTSSQIDRRSFLTVCAAAASALTRGVESPLLANEVLTPITPVREKGVGATELSQKVVALVKEFEGLALTAYRCPSGKWTIGFGHTENVRKGDTLSSVDEAAKLLMKDMDSHRREVLRVFRGVPLTQGQLDGLTSASFNCWCLKGGESGFAKRAVPELQKLNRLQDLEERTECVKSVVTHLCKYNISKKQFMDGLMRRRLSESLMIAGAEDPVVSPGDYMDLKKALVQVADAVPTKLLRNMVDLAFRLKGVRTV